MRAAEAIDKRLRHAQRTVQPASSRECERASKRHAASRAVHVSPTRERACIGNLLTSIGYHVFRIEHVRAHDVYVATPVDSSSAALEESAFVFVSRYAGVSWERILRFKQPIPPSPYLCRHTLCGFAVCGSVQDTLHDVFCR